MTGLSIELRGLSLVALSLHFDFPQRELHSGRYGTTLQLKHLQAFTHQLVKDYVLFGVFDGGGTGLEWCEGGGEGGGRYIKNPQFE